MTKYLFLYAAAATVALVCLFNYYVKRSELYSSNHAALLSSLDAARLDCARDSLSVQVLRLSCGEYESIRKRDAEHIKALKIKLKRVESVASLSTSTLVDVAAVVADTVVLRDTLRRFVWRDEWCRVEGEICGDSIRCRVLCRDSIRQVVHRVPYRFLFFKWGTKSIRQEISSSSPHSKITYSEYVKIEK